MVQGLSRRKLPRWLLLLKTWGVPTGFICAAIGTATSAVEVFYTGAGLFLVAVIVRLVNICLRNEPLIPVNERRRKRWPNISKY
ncbi:hypothetical protein GCM10009838_44800 [Catenulispora subtropica]|uniref:Uncharacterized protein n=1 Tax=Catenulispora subtropica TaxID=450798 RepID=A0ABP5DEV9_9ACTN